MNKACVLSAHTEFRVTRHQTNQKIITRAGALMGTESRHLSQSKLLVGMEPGDRLQVEGLCLTVNNTSQNSTKEQGLLQPRWRKSLGRALQGACFFARKSYRVSWRSFICFKQGQSDGTHLKRQRFSCYGSSKSWDYFACFSKQASLSPTPAAFYRQGLEHTSEVYRLCRQTVT